MDLVITKLKTDSHFFCLIDPKHVLSDSITHSPFLFQIALLAYGSLTWLVTGWVLPRTLFKPLQQTRKKLEEMESGAAGTVAGSAFHQKQKLSDVEYIQESIDRLETQLKKSTSFARSIEKGELSAAFQPCSDQDQLGQALIGLRNRLQVVDLEGQQRNWSNEGLAHFADILRSSDDLTSLCQRVISECVRYLGANQGGLFVISQQTSEQSYLELAACYAYERNKHFRKRVDIGEGLIGQAYLEKETLYLTDIPDQYLHIRSGLGTANPRSLLILPLLIQDEVEGVIELASFREFQPHEIAFLEKLAMNIASTLSSARINERTRRLLEATQQQTEQLRSQEEEMRQNLEELSATQEEMHRSQVELAGQIAALNNAAIVSEVDLQGYITYANDEFCRISKYARQELIGKKQNIVRHPDMPAEVFTELWTTITKGRVWKGEVKNRAKDGSYYWVDATITPVLGDNGKPLKYIGVRYDITAKKDQEASLRSAAQQGKL